MTAKRLPSDKRKIQIVEIAAKLFAKKGFKGVTTREIASKAKISEAILFRHFPTKGALFTEIIDRKINVKIDSFDLEKAAKGDDREIFRSVARHLIDATEADGTSIRLMFYSALENHKLADKFMSSRTNILFDFLRNHIDRQIKTKAFVKVETAVALRAFMGMFFNFIIMRELFIIPDDLKISDEDALDGFIEIFLNGMRRK